MKFFYLIGAFLYCCLAQSQRFDDFFKDETLRIDYLLAGNVTHQQAFVSQLTHMDHWYGRKENLAQTVIQGDAQLKIYDLESKQLIYILPFGSLFQEWLTQPSAKNQFKSFENAFLIPFPKEKIQVQLSFFSDQNKEQIISTEIIDPTDILIRQSKAKPNYQTIHKASILNPIRIALVAEGYTVNEQEVFMNYAQQTVVNLFKHKIFNKYKEYFEIVAVPLISTDTNVSVPSKSEWRNTALKSNFDTFYSQRYLTTSYVHNLHQQLENIPYHHIIILANTNVYGGGGILNSYSLTTTKNKEFAPVVVHEFGHSFAGLADEYFYEEDVFENKASLNSEPWEKNITSLVDFNSKWKNLLSKHTPVPTPAAFAEKKALGAYEGLKGNGLYIPTLNCRMKINDTDDFCEVCSNAIEEMILFYTSKQKK